jgi:copper chaperone CopZ
MCTGAIKKSLASLDGVKNTAVYFDPERKNQDYATLEFDQQSVTEKELIAAIEKLNDGQYKVKSVEIVINEVSFEKIDDKADKKEIKTTGKISAIPSIRIAVPSIMALLGRMLK